MIQRSVLLGLIVLAPLAFAARVTPAESRTSVPQTIDFNRDIRPILADNCYACHGPDKNKRKAHLRLDTKDGLFAGKDGSPGPVVPRKPEESELYRRLITPDANERMPEPKSGKRLAPKQISLIKRWIEQGASWKGHWAYIPPVRPALPAEESSGFVRNAVDRFIVAKLRDAGLQPSSEADRVTLIRRLSFDLTGLPPTPQEVAAFLHDSRADAYEQLVDRLLASPQYGERMAMYWLDLVRYADSIGYHSDNPMNVSPYRDYVIHAFNRNKPFDRFTIEQLAGDLLPNATLEQKVASGYNRLLQTTEEGGAQPKEYIAKYAADRVRNASTVWLGATMGCCECHDHKFDPFTTKDFYRFDAFFADVQEAAVGRREPGIPVPDKRQAAALKRLDEQLAVAQRKLATPSSQVVLAAMISRVPVVLLDRGLADVKRLQAKKDRLLQAIPKSLIAISGPPREVRILRRGNWMDEAGAVVTPAVPDFLSKAMAWNKTNAGGTARQTRLDLARWIVAPNNPLTARVFVNRLWKLYFGQGLSKTLDDLGAQGEWPTHPELLDWLATEFRDSGWSVKHMVRLLVTSETYRQTSRVRTDLKDAIHTTGSTAGSRRFVWMQRWYETTRCRSAACWLKRSAVRASSRTSRPATGRR
jgi:Protein of unknown function (DUF1549)/Protein of unknown function (DUF1553)/Planctomycete cytochrome C